MAAHDKNLQVVTATGTDAVQLHPEAQYWSNEWELLRDLMIGEKAIKDKTTHYLPQMEAQTNDEYNAFLERAYLYNMTFRSQSALVGTIFRREPKVKNFPKQHTKALKTISKDGSDLNTLIRDVASEIFTVGRSGVLVDMDRAGEGDPFLVSYIAENIIDWSVVEYKGRYVLKDVLLREIEEDRDSESQYLRTTSLRYRAIYRKLSLDDDGVYRQYIYRTKFLNNRLVTDTNPEVATPLRLGVPFDFIPFVFFGPYSNTPQVEKPPLLDIASLNISHYKSVAQLEHGRFYTALPVYYAHVKNQDEKGGTYVVGPNVVWEVEGDKAPGIIEFNGQGLMYLERALEEKEHSISAMGGRMLGTKGTATAESDNMVALKEKNELSLLLNVTNSLNEGFTKLLAWWLYWMNENLDIIDIKVEVNRDFLFKQIDAREFRAFTMMYQDGLLPIEVIYEILMKTDILPDGVLLDDFREMLDNPDQFPNNPDFYARKSGYPDMQSQIDDENADADRGAAESQLKMTQTFTAQQNKLNQKAATAKSKANVTQT